MTMTQNEALQILKMGHNVFLTGAAGSGKTFVLNKYVRYLKNCNIGVGITASTGIAATHMNGRTIHSWCGMGIKDRLDKHDIRALMENSKLARRLENTAVLIIDEISMLHSYQLDLVDKICQAFKGNEAPFGGIQVVLCGDFFQLPPVAKNGQKAHFATESVVWQNMGIKICYLEEQHRQSEDGFLEILNNIRKNSANEKNIRSLMARMNAPLAPGAISTKLYTHNIDVDAINNSELKKLKGEPEKYEMESSGKPFLAEALKKSCLAPEELTLKKGAAVMFVKNNFEKKYVNGTLGTVLDFDDEGFPIVETHSGERILAEPEIWAVEENGKIEAQIFQVPLRLAWAITVHKSQGMSLDAAQIDLSKCFEYGMGYVALSRVRSLSGVRLLGVNTAALLVNPEIMEVDEKFKEASDLAVSELAKMGAKEIKKNQRAFIEPLLPPEMDFDDIDDVVFEIAAPVFKKKEPREPNHLKTKKFILQKLPLAEIAKECGFKEDTIIHHIERLLKENKDFDIEYLKPPQNHFKKISAAFAALDSDRLKPVYEFLKEEYSYLELKIVRLFCK